MSETNQAAYEGYIEKKGWHNLFSHTEAEAGLYSYEFSQPLADSPMRSLVDVGFGSGSLLSWARSRNLQTSGLEVQKALLEAGRVAGFNVHYESRMLADQSADLLTAMDVVEHMTADELRHSLADWHRILRAGGWLVLRTPNCQSPAGLFDQFGDGTHRQMLSGPILAEFLLRSGFVVVAIRGAKNKAEFEPGLVAKLRLMTKMLVRLPARLTVRVAFGLGGAIIEPSVIVIARKPV